MDEQSRVAAARARLPAATNFVYLNAGTNGPMPDRCYETMQAFQHDELVNGRAGLAMLDKMARLRTDIRAALGAFLNAPPDNIAVTASTTDGMGRATFSFDWQPGDEIITTDVEHPGGLLPGYYAERQFGVRVKFAAIGLRSGDVTDAIAEQLTPRTKLVSVSHVIWSTGAVLDIAALSAFCRDRGLPLLVDGAQSVGAIPVDLTALDVDFYAFPGQKWLLGPSATGGLYVHPRQMDQASRSPKEERGLGKYDDVAYFHGARRFEALGKIDPAGQVGLTASVRWLHEEVTQAWAMDRAHRLAARAKASLAALPNVEVITPEPHGTLICFRVADTKPREVVNRLLREGFIIRPVEETESVRISLNFYNTDDEVDRFVARIAAFAENPAAAGG